jgi:DNA-binding response OmpR family regulator
MEGKKFSAPLKVAVVDDDPELIRAVRLVLKAAGADVFEAINGIAGYLLVRRERPDAVLLDIMMPDIDGFEVCRKLKLDQLTRNIPIIFLTARSGQDHIEKGLSLGAQGYITKPFEPDDLIDKINQVTESRASQHPQ